MKTLKYLFVAVAGFLAVSCYDLDILPKNTLVEPDLLNSDNGVQKYFAVVYHDLPIEDFNYYVNSGYVRIGRGGGRWEGQKNSPASAALEAAGRGNQYNDFDYWTDGDDNGPWYRIRMINNFIAAFPEYEDNYSQDPSVYKAAMAEAHFLRAYYYFALAKRYGGVPIHTVPLDPKADPHSLHIARSTEYDTWKFIYEDLKYAMDNGAEESRVGRANRYAAAALMSRAMLYAGSIAKYGSITGFSGDAVSAGLMGIPADNAAEFFKYAVDAAKFIQASNKYSLHTGSDKEKAYAEIFSGHTPDEDIFVKQYGLAGGMEGVTWGMYLVHSWNAAVLPMAEGMSGEVGAALQPVWNVVGLYDMPAIVDEEGKPVRFDNISDLWNNDVMEARCRANFYFSGMTETTSGTVLDMRTGIYTSFPGTAADATPNTSQSVNEYTNEYRKQAGQPASEKDTAGATYTNLNGEPITVSGLHGYAKDRGDEGFSYTGMFIRKYTSPGQGKMLHQSTQPWKALRYGEVLMNWAEAAYEYGLETGDATYKAEAFDIIAQIRDRAGASPHPMVDAPQDVENFGFPIDENLQFIRDERARELVFENLRIYDLMRWRIADLMLQNEPSRMLSPYYVLNEDKWIFLTEVNPFGREVSFNKQRYYRQIPGGAYQKNPALILNDVN